MKLTVKNLLRAKSCSFAAVAVALATMAASNAAAEKVRVFNETVTGVPAANPVVISDNVFSPEFTPGLVVQGIDSLENPSGIITQYGYLSDGTNTEPDQNTYLILDHNPGGPTPDYDYGRHFLFQGHENSGNLAYITRINLDVASPDHRITLLTPVDATGFTNFNSIDGSTWDPFTGTLLFTQDGDTRSENQLLLHTVGASWPVQWVTVHDTEINGTDPFDANALAKAARATPFKRPENGQFQPGSHFRTFFFDVTGDTDNIAGIDPVLAARGAWGGLFRVDLDANRETGSISLVVLGDADHASFDNITFVDDKDTVLLAEDRGDTLHDQLNKLDSIWAYKLNKQNPERNVVARFVALGLDRVAGVTGEEDNEPTGLHMAEGDSSINGLIGSKTFKTDRARLFFTQQHGENNLFEVFPRN